MQLAEQSSPSRLDRVPVGLVSLLSMLVLGVLAAWLVVDVLPQLFTIEASCVSGLGWQGSSGDTYFDAVMVAGTVGWLGVGVATIYASIAERRRLVLLLPVVWFLVLVVFALALAIVVGPALCAE
jgi:hypothetical protein